jgi:hypothetical protein
MAWSRRGMARRVFEAWIGVFLGAGAPTGWQRRRGECDVGTETAVPRSEAVGDDVLTKIWQTRRAELCRLERDQHQQTERKGVAEDGIHGHGMHVDMHDGRALARSSSPSGKQIRAGSSLLLFWEVRELRGEGVRPGNGGERLRFGLKRMRTWCTATGRAPRPW